jgi:hypothetical protein
MSNKQLILRAFNTLFFDFLDDIITIYPEKAEIAMAKTSFDAIKRANPTIIMKVWNSHVYSKYKAVIDAGDISFFFDKDYSTDINHLANAKKIMSIIDDIREPIRTMDDVNRQHSMKYIQDLSKLSELYADEASVEQSVPLFP